MEPTFTIEEIRKYLLSQDSFGDCLYFLSAENVAKAQALSTEESEDVENENSDE